MKEKHNKQLIGLAEELQKSKVETIELQNRMKDQETLVGELQRNPAEDQLREMKERCEEQLRTINSFKEERSTIEEKLEIFKDMVKTTTGIEAKDKELYCSQNDGSKTFISDVIVDNNVTNTDDEELQKASVFNAILYSDGREIESSFIVSKSS